MFDIACGLAQRVPLTKLVALDRDIRIYLTKLMVTLLAWAGEALIVLESMKAIMITREAFNNMLLKKTSHNFDSYGLVSRQVLGLEVEGMPKKVEQVYCKHLDSRLD